MASCVSISGLNYIRHNQKRGQYLFVYSSHQQFPRAYRLSVVENKNEGDSAYEKIVRRGNLKNWLKLVGKEPMFQGYFGVGYENMTEKCATLGYDRIRFPPAVGGKPGGLKACRAAMNADEFRYVTRIL